MYAIRSYYASPITGIAGAAQHTDGTFISSQNNLLATVYAVSPIWINFSMSESELLRYRRELAMGSLKAPTNGEFLVEVVLPDGTLFPCTGRITFASPIYNPETGTFLVRSSIDNSHPGGLTVGFQPASKFWSKINSSQT